MRTKLALAAVAALLLQAVGASAQVSVTATAGTTGPTPYTTVKLAFDAINAGTHQGDITIDIQASTVEGATPAVLNSSGAGAALYTSVLIRPTADAVSIVGTSPGGRGVIELNGSDNVTIDGDNPNSAGTNRDLTIQNTATSTTTFTSAVRVALSTLVSSGNNNTFKNTVVLGSATGRNIASATSTSGSEHTTYCILVGGGASTTAATNPPSAITSVSTLIGTGITATSLNVSNNRIDSCARGIALQGSATTVGNLLSVTNNLIGSATAGNTTTVYSRAMTLQGFDNATISGNTIQNIESFIGTQTGGIFTGDVSSSGTNALIERNFITNVFNQNAVTFGAYGINAGVGNAVTIRNNFVSNINHVMTGGASFSTTFGVFGIRLGSGNNHKVYHNSVNLFGAHPGTPNTSLLSAALAIVATTQTGIDVRNNALANNLSGGTTSVAHVSVYLPSGGTSAMNLTLSYNGYYSGTDPARQGLAQAGTTAGTNFFLASNFNASLTTPSSNFRSYSSTLSAAGSNDSASFATTGAVPFTSGTDLHVPNGTTTLLESRGVDTAVTGVTTDIDGEARPNGIAPDAGADEFSGTGAPANDVASVQLVTPASGAILPNGTTLSPQARFHNVGAAAQLGVSVQFTITGPGGYNYSDTQVIATVSAGQIATVTFAPAPAFAVNGSYSMAATVLTADANPANDQITGSFDVQDPVAAGIHTVPGDYPSLTNNSGAFQILNALGSTGNVTFEITADLTSETGTHALNQVPGGFTVTIKPSGAPRTISGTSTTLGLIKLNGADFVTIDGSLSGGTDRSLTIMNGNANATVIWIASLTGNGATNNTVKNTILSGTPGIRAIAGVLSGSGTTFGAAAEAANSNNTIQNNEIYRVQNSAFLSGVASGLDQNWLITGNTFGSTIAADKNIFRGMLLGNAGNFTISNNIINGVSSTTTTTSTMSGIQLASALNTGSIFGNRISDIKHNNPAGWGANGIFSTASSTASNVSIFNNFIWDVMGQGFGGVAQSDNGYGIMLNSGGGYNLSYNSVLMGTNQVNPASITAAINIASGITTAGSISLRDNIFANTQTIGTRYSIYDASTATIFSTINFNDYFSSQNVGFLTVARPTLADWQTATGQDGSSKAVDPLYVSGTDLHLQAASPLFGQGTPIAGITTDIDGDTRNATNPDIGADEAAVKADVSVTKSDGPDPVAAGANLTYQITFTNNGPNDASSAAWSDVLPAGTTFVSLSNPGGSWSCTTPPVGSGGTASCTNPSLAPGADNFFLTVFVDPGVPEGTVLSNTVTADSATADPVPGNDSATATTSVLALADISVSKVDTPDPVTAGSNITYTITLTNAGPSNAASVTLTDSIPSGTTFVSIAAPAGWSCTTPSPLVAGSGVQCTNPSLTRSSAVFTLKVKVDAATPSGTVITNTATGASTTGDPNPGNESGTATTTVVGLANVGVSMTVDDPTPAAGQNVTFDVVVSCASGGNATGVQVTDLLPTRLSFVSAAPSQGSYNPATGLWDVGSVGGGSSVNLLLTATVTTTDTIVNTATKTAQGEADPDSSNNTAVVDLNGLGPADVQIVKTVDNTTPGQGTDVTFLVTATNGGPEDAIGVEVTDLLPAGLTFVSATASQGSYVPGNGLWTVGDIPAGNFATLQIVATVNGAGAITNVATKTDQANYDYINGNDSASVTLNDDTVADLSLSMTASHEPAAPGTTMSYTIVVGNLGPAQGTGVTVTDDLPSGVVLISATTSQGNCTGTTSVVCDLGALNPGAAVQITLLVNKTAAGQVDNSASVAGNEADPNMDNNSDGVTTTPVELHAIEIE